MKAAKNLINQLCPERNSKLSTEFRQHSASASAHRAAQGGARAALGLCAFPRRALHAITAAAAARPLGSGGRVGPRLFVRIIWWVGSNKQHKACDPQLLGVFTLRGWGKSDDPTGAVDPRNWQFLSSLKHTDLHRSSLIRYLEIQALRSCSSFWLPSATSKRLPRPD